MEPRDGAVSVMAAVVERARELLSSAAPRGLGPRTPCLPPALPPVKGCSQDKNTPGHIPWFWHDPLSILGARTSCPGFTLRLRWPLAPWCSLPLGSVCPGPHKMWGPEGHGHAWLPQPTLPSAICCRLQPTHRAAGQPGPARSSPASLPGQCSPSQGTVWEDQEFPFLLSAAPVGVQSRRMS